MRIVYNGQRLAITGWFEDGHGHRLFMRRDDLAPICPYQGVGLAVWRLVREVAEQTPSPR